MVLRLIVDQLRERGVPLCGVEGLRVPEQVALGQLLHGLLGFRDDQVRERNRLTEQLQVHGCSANRAARQSARPWLRTRQCEVFIFLPQHR